ncbi:MULTISPECIES: peptide chain release factor H [unclassified Roseovarius]|uniref:peptide chain release factor H n=1 Tax=unclassified Roseovarius TaxID=2614913 RepID=UPI00273E9A4A|nr:MULTISPECIES: peptide chain release factor H [unclassified Roseovarius]
MTAPRHISLLVTSGSGPAECQQAVAGVLEVMRREAKFFAVDFDTNGARTIHGFKSAVAVISGADADAFAKKWRGTIRWRAQSNLRPTHKRANWFIGVYDLPASVRTPERIQASDVTFDTFRAGGPGGQHQNTTNSAVRATHRSTGLSAVAREERSQHRNKSLALERLQHLMAAQAAADESAQKASRNELHYAHERGNPVRCFKGRGFREVKGG